MTYCPCPSCEGQHTAPDERSRRLTVAESRIAELEGTLAEMSRTRHSNSLADWQRACHTLARTKGWHDDAATQNETDYVAAACANLHGEVSELWEAARRGKLQKQCDKPVALTCIEEELADVVIRVFDTAGRLGVDIERAVARKHAYNATRPQRHGGKVR